jgi:arsenate reductase (thioredoxin)
MEEAVERDQRYNVLFLCTRNASRGILAEALLNLRGAARFRAYSAGTRPAGAVNGRVLELLERLAIPTDGLRSKSWDEYAGESAPRMDFIFVLCDRAAAEQCPQWPGHPVTAQWSIPDPGMAEGTEVEKAAAYRSVFNMLERRISLFLSLPLESIDRLSMIHHLDAIGREAEHGPASAVLHPSQVEVGDPGPRDERGYRT